MEAAEAVRAQALVLPPVIERQHDRQQQIRNALHYLDQGPIEAVDQAMGTVVGGEDDAQSSADKAC